MLEDFREANVNQRPGPSSQNFPEHFLLCPFLKILNRKKHKRNFTFMFNEALRD
jgi:hypothetical protein